MIKNQKTFTFIKTALCFLFGLLFILPVLLIVMNALKPNGEILTSFISVQPVSGQFCPGNGNDELWRRI